MAYFKKELVVPKNHLHVKPEAISIDDVWAAPSFGWKGLATVPVMGAARALSDIATILVQDVLPQDARNPKVRPKTFSIFHFIESRKFYAEYFYCIETYMECIF
jgi:hypothetical protein